MNAIEKLNKAKENATGEQGKVLAFLIGRCKQSKALCDDVMNAKKSFENCVKYYTDLARKEAAKQMKSGYVGIQIDDEKVYEWAEDYFHAQNLDIDNPKPKAEPQKFDKDKAIAKAQASVAKNAPKKSAPQKKATVVQMPKKPAPKPTPKPSAPKAVEKPKKAEEQFTLFDFM